MKKFLLVVLLLFLIPSGISARNLDVKIGTSISDGKSEKVSSKSIIKIVKEDGTEVKNTKTNEVTVSFSDGKITLLNPLGEKVHENFPSDGSLLLSSENILSALKRQYRGRISFRINSKKLDVVNNVELEDYLKGVVPNELGPSNPTESLKAQAIVSRSFALANLNKYQKLGYNLNDTTSSQVYRGFGSEKEATNKAIEATKSLVCYFNGSVANTIFGASSGGVTADAAEVWGGKSQSYLASFVDEYSDYPWNLEIDGEELSKKLSNLGIGRVNTLGILSRDSSGRVEKLTAIGSNGTKELSGNTLRSTLGSTKFKSTLFNFQGGDFINLVGNIKISGNGYGHGVGLSQYGAVNMAKAGKNYEEILKYYFRGVEIVNEDK